MKKVGLDMMLGRQSKCHYKKKVPKTVIIKARLPAGEATKAPPFGSTLGLYGVKADDFCNFFNKDSLKFWEKGTIISVVILISPSKSYILEYKLPTVYSLLESYFKVHKYTEEGMENKSIFSAENIKERLIFSANKEYKKLTSVLKDNFYIYDFRYFKKKYKRLVNLWRPIYQIAVIKSQQTNPIALKGWIMQVIGTIHSCNYGDPKRREKKNRNFGGRRK